MDEVHDGICGTQYLVLNKRKKGHGSVFFKSKVSNFVWEDKYPLCTESSGSGSKVVTAEAMWKRILSWNDVQSSKRTNPETEDNEDL